MNIFQILAICGMLSPIFYAVMWILGGFLRSDYSHIRDDISSLFAVGAPRKRLFNAFIIASSVLLFVFYLGLHWGLNNGHGSILGPIIFMFSGLLSVLVAFFFPLDVAGEIITYRGKLHLILVVLSGFLNIVGMLALGLDYHLLMFGVIFPGFLLFQQLFHLYLLFFLLFSLRVSSGV